MPRELRLTTDEFGVVDNDSGDANRFPAIVWSAEVWSEGRFCRARWKGHVGEQRIRMLVGTRPGETRFRFQYSIDDDFFGELALPKSSQEDESSGGHGA